MGKEERREDAEVDVFVEEAARYGEDLDEDEGEGEEREDFKAGVLGVLDNVA